MSANLIQDAIAGGVTVFDSADAGKTVKKPTMRGLLRSIPVYRWPVGVDVDRTKACFVALTILGQSTSQEILHWQTWIATLTCLGFPEFADKLESETEYKVKDLPASFISSVAAADSAIEGGSPAENIVFPMGMPSTTNQYTVYHYNAASLYAVYGYLALVTHLMAKKVTEKTRDKIEGARPQNIKDKFTVGDSDFVLSGPGKIGRHAHDWVPHAWSQSTVLRVMVVEEYATFAGSTELGPEIIFTLFKMLANAGMQGATFIHKLLEACDWVYDDVPILRPSLRLYAQSVKDYMELDATVRPYYKIIKGDQTKMFNAKAMGDLIGVAVMWLSQTVPTIGGYTAPGGEEAKRAFITAARARGIKLNPTSHSVTTLAPSS